MKAASPIDYKALYEQALRRVQEQEKTIAFLHDDVTKCLQEQQRLEQVVSSQQKTLLQKEAIIEAGQSLIASHEQLLHNQSEKISQQEVIITSLNQLVLQLV